MTCMGAMVALLLTLLHPTFVSANFTLPGSNIPTMDGLAVGTIEGGNTIDELLVMNHATPEEILFNHKFPGPDSHSLRFAPHFNRPPGDGKYSVTSVSVQLALINIMEVDEKAATIEINCWVRLTWTDARLAWNPADYDGIKNIEVDPHDMWTPDLVFYCTFFFSFPSSPSLSPWMRGSRAGVSPGPG